MTPDERDLLSRFLDDLGRARPGPKDAEAAAQIESALRANPDAAYVLVQHAILADHALADAQARIAELERQVAEGGASPPAAQTSFLGALFNKGAAPNPPGVGQAGPYGERGGSAVPPTGGQGGWFEPAPPQGPGGGHPGGGYPGGPFNGGGGLGGFLRNAGQTAAGVAGGAFLFEGLSSLFGGHRGGGFGGGYGFADAPTENVTINEYGDRDGGRAGFADVGGGGYDDVNYDSDNGDLGGDDYS